MLASLSVREVGAIVLMHRQAETALEASDVVLEEVRILVEVDGLERELAETLTAVGIRRGGRGDAAAAKLGAGAILSWLADRLESKLQRTYLVVHIATDPFSIAIAG